MPQLNGLYCEKCFEDTVLMKRDGEYYLYCPECKVKEKLKN